MAIYTITGDKGKTSLFDGTRVLKSNKRIDACGDVDELNSVLGVAISEMEKKHTKIRKECLEIQHDLFEIGSSLAMPPNMPAIGINQRVLEFEQLIDELTKKLPELSEFILPSGSKAGSMLHFARTIARRAERKIVFLMQKDGVDEEVVKYLNRLSDLLFTMARFVNQTEKNKEIVWRKK